MPCSIYNSHNSSIEHSCNYKQKCLQLQEKDKQNCLLYTKKGVDMFLGLFIVLASVLTLLEDFGVITTNIKWGIPLAFACLGLSIIFENFRKKDNK